MQSQNHRNNNKASLNKNVTLNHANPFVFFLLSLLIGRSVSTNPRHLQARQIIQNDSPEGSQYLRFYYESDETVANDFVLNADGSTVSVGSHDQEMLLFKADALGNKEYDVILTGSNGENHLKSIAKGGNNDYFACGKTSHYGRLNDNGIMMRFHESTPAPSQDFKFDWLRVMTSSQTKIDCIKILVDSNNDVFTVSVVNGGVGIAKESTMVAKFDKDANLLWHNVFGGTQSDFTKSAAFNDDQSQICVLSDLASDRRKIPTLSCLDTQTGEAIARVSVDFNDDGFTYSLRQSPEGDTFIVGGNTQAPPATGRDLMLFNINQNLTTLRWTKIFENRGYGDILDTASVEDGTVYFTGTQKGLTDGAISAMFLGKLDPQQQLSYLNFMPKSIVFSYGNAIKLGPDSVHVAGQATAKLRTQALSVMRFGFNGVLSDCAFYNETFAINPQSAATIITLRNTMDSVQWNKTVALELQSPIITWRQNTLTEKSECETIVVPSSTNSTDSPVSSTTITPSGSATTRNPASVTNTKEPNKSATTAQTITSSTQHQSQTNSQAPSTENSEARTPTNQISTSAMKSTVNSNGVNNNSPITEGLSIGALVGIILGAVAVMVSYSSLLVYALLRRRVDKHQHNHASNPMQILDPISVVYQEESSSDNLADKPTYDKVGDSIFLDAELNSQRSGGYTKAPRPNNYIPTTATFDTDDNLSQDPYIPLPVQMNTNGEVVSRRDNGQDSNNEYRALTLVPNGDGIMEDAESNNEFEDAQASSYRL